MGQLGTVVSGSKRVWRLALVGVPLVAGAVAFTTLGGPQWLRKVGSGKTEETQQQAMRSVEPVAVTVAALTPRPVRRTVQVVGTLNGHEEVTITPKVEGRVVKILRDVGDSLKPGDVLLEIEDIDYRLAALEAEKAVELELAKLGLTSLPKGEWNDVSSLPSVARAMSLVDNARALMDRARRVGMAISKEDRDKIHTDLQVAQATREQAIMEAKATLAAARHKQAQLEIARLKLAETRVVAPQPSPGRLPRTLYASAAAGTDTLPPPVEWVVSQRLVSEGEMVRAFPSMAAFKLVIDRSLKLLATVPERHVGDLKVGQAVTLSVEAYPGESFPGTVARINPTVDRASRTFQVEVSVPNESRRLRAGSFARATVFVREDPRAPTVPEEAVVTFAGVTKVFTVCDSKAQVVPVRLGERLQVQDRARNTRWVEVIGELPPDSQVVTSGHSQLAEAMPVRVRGDDSPQKPRP